MTVPRSLSWIVVVVLAFGVASPAPAGEATEPFECAELRLRLDGAPYFYWTSAEQGRIVLVRQCAPAASDCDHDVIVVHDGQGRKLLETAPLLEIPGMRDGHVLDAALRTPDRLVVSAVVDRTEPHPVLAEFDVASGRLLRVAPTGTVLCRDLHGDDRGVVWCLGVDSAKRHAGADFDLVYRFGDGGTLIGSTLRRSTLAADAAPLSGAGRAGTRGGLLPGDGAIALWLPSAGELVRFDDAGAVAARVPLPEVREQRRAEFVSAPGGEVFALLTVGPEGEPDRWAQALHRLGPEGEQWEHVPGSVDRVPLQITLVGVDENGLVLLDRATLGLCHRPIPGSD